MFPWAFEGLFKNRHTRRDRTLFVIEAILQYVSSELPGLAVDIRARDLRQLPQQKRTYCGLTSAAEQTGIPRHTIIRLIRRGKVQCRTALRGSQAIYEIKTEFAKSLRIDYLPTLSHREASKLLGITHHLYRDLRHSGVLKKHHNTMMPHGIAICDLEEFKRNIVTKAKKKTTTAGLFSLEALRVKRCPRSARVNLIEGILRGTVRCFYTRTRPQRVSDMLVRQEDVTTAIAATTSPTPPTLDQIRARYRLSYHEAHTLARHLSGVPDADKKIAPGTVNEEKVAEFMTRYQGLTAYGQERDETALRALARLRRARTRLLAIPVPHHPGRKVYFVPRSATCVASSLCK